MPTPAVSVVISVYNGLPYLEEAIESILRQTFENFEFIIINDGSSDGSKEVLERLAGQDGRIRLVHQKNLGLPAALNRGIGMAGGKYIARMDADDISLAGRLQHQVDFLNEHPEVGVLGTQISEINDEGTEHPNGWLLPTTPGFTAWRTLFRCCICHPSVMMRRHILSKVGGYDVSLRVAQDFDLWTRLILHTGLQNLPEVLFKRRKWGGNATIMKADNQSSISTASLLPLHEQIMQGEVSPHVVSFLHHQQHGGAAYAAKETGGDARLAEDCFSHVLKLHSAFTQRFEWAATDRQKITQDVYQKLFNIAQVVGAESKFKGWTLKAQAHLLIPRRIPRWLLAGVRRRVTESKTTK